MILWFWLGWEVFLGWSRSLKLAIRGEGTPAPESGEMEPACPHAGGRAEGSPAPDWTGFVVLGLVGEVMDGVKITLLVENVARKNGLLAEHGLAFWIEVGAKRFLFDTGQTVDVLLHNARELGIDLGAADAVLLSHGHYDHTGGLEAVAGLVKNARLFLHPDALLAKFNRKVGGVVRYIGMSEGAKGVLGGGGSECTSGFARGFRAEGSPAPEKGSGFGEVVYTVEPTEIGEGLFLTGAIPRVTDFEDAGGEFFRGEECLVPDELMDDQAAFIDTKDGVVVILGCAHAGIINTLLYVKTLLPGRPIHSVIGGTHLVTADKVRVDKTVEALGEFDVGRIYPLHCTGFGSAARLWNEFPGRVSVPAVGWWMRELF